MSDLRKAKVDSSKRIGRGRGILGLSNNKLCGPPGIKSRSSGHNEDLGSKSNDGGFGEFSAIGLFIPCNYLPP